MIALAAAAGAALMLAFSLLRLFVGPTLYDRALAASSATTKAALICAGLGAAFYQVEAVDVAFVLVLAGFVFNVAVLKFFRARTFQAPMARGEE